MLAGNEDSPADHVARCLRGYLSSFHVDNPDKGCALTALGPEIARAGPEVRRAVEASLKRTQKKLERSHRRLRRRLGIDRPVRRRRGAGPIGREREDAQGAAGPRAGASSTRPTRSSTPARPSPGTRRADPGADTRQAA
jgi:hypothetical protein